MNQKEKEKLENIISSLTMGDMSLSDDEISLARQVTVGDLVVVFNLTLSQIDMFLSRLDMLEKQSKNFGFHYDENSLKESRKVKVNSSTIRKLIKEACECEELSMHIQDPYNPQENEMGGLDFEDHGAGEQAGMIKSNLHSIFTKSNSMYDMIGENDRLPEWLQEKIAVADHMIDTAHDYLKHEYNVLSVNESYSGNQPAGSFVGYFKRS
jgi:hypothetical protein